MVTTPNEVFLCALTRAATDDPAASALELVPTTFELPPDNHRILSVAGTESGRIFLGDEDGCLHEMTYDLGDRTEATRLPVEEQLVQFYDEGKNLPDVIHEDESSEAYQHRAEQLLTLGKRAWSSLAGSDYGSPVRKCTKVNRTSRTSATIQAVVPDFLLRGASFLFGGKTSTGGGSIEHMVVDEARGCLYSLSSKGWICAFDLGTRSTATATATAKPSDDMRLAAVMDGTQTAQLYLGAIARNQTFPPSSSTTTTGLIAFAGGASSARAGVGGMDGARTILKLAAGPTGRPESGTNILKPTSIHVISPTESSRLTLVAVTAGGLRLYLSSLTPQVIQNGPNAAATPRYGRSARSPLAPHSRLTLCHVRSPPPLKHNNQDLAADSSGGVVGGIPPRVQGKLAQVDASVYDEGMLVSAVVGSEPPRSTRISGMGNRSAAIVNGRRRQHQHQQHPVGDIIVATCPYPITRKVETQNSSSSNDKSEKDLNSPTLGGITESVTLPMSVALGGDSNGVSTAPGGIIWDFAVTSPKESAVMNLTANSSTPTGAELELDLPPAYFPPSEVRARDLARPVTSTAADVSGGGALNGDSTALLPSSSSISLTNMKVLGNVLTNWFNKPIRHGLEFDLPLDGEKLDNYGGHHKNYRISRRDASRGFSTSAGEGTSSVVTARTSTADSRSKTSRSPRSARLRPWLLRPAAVSLNYLSTQYYSQSKEIVALNSGGLHYFGFVPVLTSLADALVAAGDSVKSDSTITKFFEGYGYKEGCCMCLGLAIGCGPSGSLGEQVRQQASTAALARAYVPTLIPISDADQTASHISSGITNSTDKLVPVGYEFRGSYISKGVTALVSRLLRPIWHKPAVVVTEGRSVKLRWSTKPRTTPAKVEILLSDSTLEEIRALLHNLSVEMKTVFSRAIKSVPGSVQQQQGSMMDLDDYNEEDNHLSRALQYNSHLSGGNSGGMSVQLSPLEAERKAQLIEEKNLHSMYRLLTRVMQLLNLMSLLRRAQGMEELREVDWGLLHGLTIAKLVQTSEGQDRLESLLNSLVTASASGRSLMPVTSAQADQLANRFAEQCYLFFSPGSRFAYLGLRKANEALQQPEVSSSRASFANQAAEHLRQAARHWHSAPLVTGRILHTRGKENYYQIATRALKYGSPLATAAEALMDLGDVGTLVDICLITASNFQGDRHSATRSTDTFAFQRSYELIWEQNLYHKRRDEVQENGNSLPSARPSNQPSSTNIIAFGTDVTSRDAVDTCYAIIFYHLSSLLNSRSNLADRLVYACSGAPDKLFLEAFFTHLLENDHADTLLRINSPALDKWLRDKKDPELLWRYYDVQKRHQDAGEVAYSTANDAKVELSLSARIEWLSRSVNSYNSALEETHYGRFVIQGGEDVAKKAERASNSLHIAKLQSRILSAIGREANPDMYERLTTRLVPVVELYNDFAAKLGMSEECLLILHACRHNDVQSIPTLWKTVLCEQILPCATRNKVTYQSLKNFVAEVGLERQIQFLEAGEQVGTLALFEKGDWQESVARRVVALGKDLFGSGADFVFPVGELLSYLEGKFFGESVLAHDG